MKLLSCNIRNALMREADERNAWACRREAMVALIKKADPDILALQEDSEEQRRYLEEPLAPTHGIYCDPDFYEADHSYNAIFVRKSIEVLDSGAFWISEEGREPSKLASSICFRHATYVRIRSSGKKFTIVNVHLDHAAEPGFKAKEMEKFLGLLKSVAGAVLEKTIVAGDFNSEPDSSPHRLMQRAHFLDAAELKNNARPSFTGWGDGLKSERIDYIWLSNDLKENLKSYRVLDESYRRSDESTGYPSDHFALFAKFEF